MAYTNKPFEELDIMDDFLISAIAADPEVGEAFCRKILSVLLGRNIGKIRVTPQYVLPAPTPLHRGIRMDVEVEETEWNEQGQPANIYDLEPHLQTNINLPKHNRFYQAKMDARYMRRGDMDFSRMPNLYVITILNFDPFGYDHMMYTIENRCMEIEDLKYGDGLKFIYFYTGGAKGGSKEIKTLLQYLQHSRAEYATDDSTRELHRYVNKVKVSPEVRQGYMMFEDFIYYKCKAAAEEATGKTMVQNTLELLADYGEVPAPLKEKLESTNDMDLLKKYLKLAAKADSIEAFWASLSDC